jgi:hypothetical protein
MDTHYLLGVPSYLHAFETRCPDCRMLTPAGQYVEWHRWGCSGIAGVPSWTDPLPLPSLTPDGTLRTP